MADVRTSNADSSVRGHMLLRARALVDACHITVPPVDLARLAREVRIERVRELDIRLDGQLVALEGGGYEVILSRNAPTTRKRFTLAHEIAHVLLAAEGRDAGCGDAAVEELCNAMAAELLMPHSFLEMALQPREPLTVALLRQMARRFQCSLEAMAWRVFNSGHRRGALFIWRVAAEAGEPTLELSGLPQTWGLRLPLKRGAVLSPKDLLWHELMENQNRHVRLYGLRSSRPYAGDCERFPQTVLVLLDVDFNDASANETGQVPRVDVQGKLAF